VTVRRLLAALLAVTAGLAVSLTAGVPLAAATGGYCTGAGVNVVVDFTGQGGGIQRGCAAHGAGGNAWDAFEAAGFPLTGVQRYPGAVCRVSGRPADAPCQTMPPADAYWGFFTSHGSGWNYASVGPSSYRVANGDTVGFAWQTGGHRAPGAAPAPVRASAPAPSRTPATAPTPAPSRQPAGGSNARTGSHPRSGTVNGAASPSSVPSATAATTTPAAAAGGRAQRHRAGSAAASARPTGTTTPTPSADATPQADAVPSAPVSATPAARSEGGVPWWVPVLVLVLLGGAGGAFVWRRRTALR
jgi:hypothetical protein